MRDKTSSFLSRVLAGWFLALVCLSGCATAQRTTMLAELTLAKATSLGYRTVDGIDKVKTDAILADIAAGNKAKANTDFVAYKPKIEKARQSLNMSDDTLQHAENLRVAATKGAADWKDYTAWLPALTAAIALVQQAIADVKGLLP